MKRLATIFDPGSKSIKRRYWYAQLYRALAFAQVTFSNDSDSFATIASKLRSVLAGNFEIEWNGEILGYWIDMQGDSEIRSATDVPNVSIYDIPQIAIQELLLGEHTVANYIPMSDKAFISEEEQIQKIVEREKKLKREIQAIQEGKKAQNKKLKRSLII